MDAVFQPETAHKQLRELTGIWDIDCSYFADPDQEPIQTQGIETTKMLGDL